MSNADVWYGHRQDEIDFELKDSEKFHFSHPLSAVDLREVNDFCEDCYNVEMDCDSHKIVH